MYNMYVQDLFYLLLLYLIVAIVFLQQQTVTDIVASIGHHSHHCTGFPELMFTTVKATPVVVLGQSIR